MNRHQAISQQYIGEGWFVCVCVCRGGCNEGNVKEIISQFNFRQYLMNNEIISTLPLAW